MARRRKDWRALEGEGLGEEDGGRTSLCMQLTYLALILRGYTVVSATVV